MKFSEALLVKSFAQKLLVSVPFGRVTLESCKSLINDISLNKFNPNNK